jgi:hypothetical protein
MTKTSTVPQMLGLIVLFDAALTAIDVVQMCMDPKTCPTNLLIIDCAYSNSRGQRFDPGFEGQLTAMADKKLESVTIVRNFTATIGEAPANAKPYFIAETKAGVMTRIAIELGATEVKWATKEVLIDDHFGN